MIGLGGSIPDWALLYRIGRFYTGLGVSILDWAACTFFYR